MNGILKSSDGYLIITQRALWVGEHPGMLDTPGGHPEPANIDPIFNLKFNSEDCFDQVGQMNQNDVILEIFKSQKDEMELEFNIDSNDLSFPVLFSIGRIKSGNGRIVIYFFIETTRTKQEILNSWSKTLVWA